MVHPAIVAGFDKGWVGAISKTYPGRVTVAERNFGVLREEMGRLAEVHGLEDPQREDPRDQGKPHLKGSREMSKGRSMLLTRGVSGMGVITGWGGRTQRICRPCRT